MSAAAVHLLLEIDAAARRQKLTRTQLAAHAGLTREAVSRVFTRGRADLDTVAGLARAVGLRLALVPDNDFAAQLAKGTLLDDA